jgi:hypothetical protein
VTIGADERRTAEDLAARLSRLGVPGRAAGAGVHWQVDVGPVGTRTMIVHCFWYDRAISGLMLGMNPSNARSHLRPARAPYEGPEYYAILRDRGGDVVDGRTRDVAEAVAGARAWLAGADLESLAREVPFIDRKGRAMRALAARINPALRVVTGRDPGYEVWVKGDDRSCTLRPEDGGASSCAFLIGQAQIARAAAVDDVSAAVDAWLVDKVPVGALAARVPGVELERHAEVLEIDPARWHWLHVRDRIANPHDVLAPLRPLIEALATSPLATKFYTYSSLSSLCFSASSHYPWADDRMPIVWPLEGGLYLVGDDAARRVGYAVERRATRCDLPRAVELIEAMLAASPVAPFFGSASDG